MCEICCADTPEKRKAVSDYLLHQADAFARLSGHYRGLAHGQVKPHANTSEWDRAKLDAKTALRAIVDDLV